MTNDLFHPAVAAWFGGQFDEPSDIHKRVWPVIKERRNILIAAPTGSGKTLAAFLASVDDPVRQSQYGSLDEGTQIVYVSPLKALSNDIHANRQAAAISDSVRRGELDRIIIPEQPLDVLAQQIITEVANCDYREDELYHLVRRAYPNRDLSRGEFDGVVAIDTVRSDA